MTQPDFLFGLTPGDLVYDEETYPNAFLIGLLHRTTRQYWQFEISPRRNDLFQMCLFVATMQQQGCRMIGFNNIGFDYPVLHWVIKAASAHPSPFDIYNKAMAIIKAPDNQRFAHMVWENEWLVPQVDLFKIHHFDNVAKATSLKMLEFNMRMDIEDLPFDVGIHLTNDQIQVLADYMQHDIKATDEFCDRSGAEIDMRERLTEKFDRNMINMSNTKIGETILITEMEQRGLQCYDRSTGKKLKRQTLRDSINLNDAIFPYIKFEHPEFNRILTFLRSKTITETKGVFSDLIAEVDGLSYKFGTGGLHASVDSSTVRSNDTHQLIDVDVSSFYPNLAIQNKLYPAHLGEAYCDAYLGVYETRKTYPKKTPENNAYKEALNASYGNSNNKHSPLFDSLYTMTTTLGGQLSLCMLIEQLIKIPGLRMIQANTDGVTYLCPKEYVNHSRSVCSWWEDVTRLELEEVLYSAMYIRDVNNYIAVDTGGKVKRIGAYAHETALENPGTRELPWHKDWSALVVPKAAEAALVYGRDIREFIMHHPDIYDFMLRTKVPRSSTLEWGGQQVQNIVRYYISTEGRPLEKVMPAAGPLGAYKKKNGVPDHYYQQVLQEVGDAWDERIHTKNQSRYEIRRTGIHTGWTVELCNRLTPGVQLDGLNYEWYIKEAEKLVKPLLD